MKKLFLFLTAALVSTSMWAGLPTLPTSTLNVPNFPNSGWKGNMSPSVIDTTDSWYILSPYEIYQSAFAWSNTAGGGSSNQSDVSKAWSASGLFPGAARYTGKDSKYYWATLKEFDSSKHYYGYRVTNCEAVALLGASGSNKKRTIYLAAYEITDNTLPDSANATKTVSFESSDLTQIKIEDLDASKEYYIYVTQKGTGSGGSSSGNSNFYLIAFKSAPLCSAPDDELELNLSKTSDVYVGNEITVGYTGGNGGDVTITLDGVEFTSASWTATLGTHTFIASQDDREVSSELKCGGSDTISFTVASSTPVSSATASASSSKAKIGTNVTLSVDAANATTYQWYSNTTASNEGGTIIEGATSDEYVVTKDVAGAYYFYVTATNAFTATPIVSNVVTVNFLNPCYEILYDLEDGIGSAAATASDATVNEGVSLVLSNTAGRITLTPASGFQFKNGDIIEFSGSVGNSGKPFGIIIGSQNIYTEDITPNDPGNASAGGTAATSGVLALAADAATIAFGRYGGTTTTITTCIIKREVTCKDTISRDTTLTAVKVNDVTLNSDSLSILKTAPAYSLKLKDSYIGAPVIKFNKHIVLEFDDSTSSEQDVEVSVTAEEVADVWKAQATIAGITYTVTADITPSYTISYYDGSKILSDEVVVKGESPVDYATYEAFYGSLGSFVDWYTDDDLAEGHKIADISALVVDEDLVVYGKWTKSYASSIDFITVEDEYVDQLAAKNYALDCEDMTKVTYDDNSNLYDKGLKIKKNGTTLSFIAEAGKAVDVTTGIISGATLSVNSGAAINLTITTKSDASIKTRTFYSTSEQWFVIETTTDAYCIFKSIAIHAPYVVTYNANGGTCTPASATFTGTAITLPKPTNSPKYFAGWYDDATDGELIGWNGDDYIPTANITLYAHWSNTPTGIDNTEDEVKAVKYFKDGQIFIEKNGHVYNVFGACIK